MRIEALLFDLGDTLIEQVIDSEQTLDKLRLTLMPDVKPTLDLLHQYYRMGILTNTTQSKASDVLKGLDNLSVGEYFDAVVTSYELGLEKPNPSIFKALLKQLNVSPENAVMIGNERTKDIEAAKRL